MVVVVVVVVVVYVGVKVGGVGVWWRVVMCGDVCWCVLVCVDVCWCVLVSGGVWCELEGICGVSTVKYPITTYSSQLT